VVAAGGSSSSGGGGAAPSAAIVRSSAGGSAAAAAAAGGGGIVDPDEPKAVQKMRTALQQLRVDVLAAGMRLGFSGNSAELVQWVNVLERVEKVCVRRVSGRNGPQCEPSLGLHLMRPLLLRAPPPSPTHPLLLLSLVAPCRR
jgi:hypothetical protein